MTIHRNFIAGEWLEGGDETRNINPSNTDEVIGVYTRASRKDAETAIASARKDSGSLPTFPSRKRVSPMARTETLWLPTSRRTRSTTAEASPPSGTTVTS